MTKKSETALNLRNFDPELRASLKNEAKENGVGLAEYVFSILAKREQLQARPVVPIIPIQLPASTLKQDEPPTVGDWDSPSNPGPQPISVVSGPGVVETKRKACDHGYMVRALCAVCSAL